MNEIVAVDQELLAKLDAMNDDGRSSSNRSSDGVTTPILKISYNNGHAGHFHMNYQGQDYFSEKVSFRPLVQSFKWSHFDFDTKEMVVETIEVRNIFQEEPIDTKGTIRCGKPPSKNLDKEARDKWKHITFNRILRGVVDIGELTNIPCIMFLKGASRDVFESQYFDRLSGSQHMRDFKCELSTKQEKTGAVKYFVLVVDPKFDDQIPVDQPTVETIQVFTKQIEDKNKAIRDKYTETLKANNEDQTSIKALKDALDDEFKEAS